MQIIKIGGSKIVNQKNLQILLQIINELHKSKIKSIVVISAFGKTSKNLKKILDLAININYLSNNANINSQNITINNFNNKFYHQKIVQQKLNHIFEFHHNLINNKTSVKLNTLFEQLSEIVNAVFNLNNYSKKTLDLVLSFGELISLEVLKIAFENFNLENKNFNITIFNNIKFIDATDFIVTDSNYNNANINIEATKDKLNIIQQLESQILITQGFIGQDLNGIPTTLGFESSNYTAIILAELLNIKKLVIYSDTFGILDSDPRVFSQTANLSEINYEEAETLAKLGLKIISEKMITSAKLNNIKIEYKSLFCDDIKEKNNNHHNHITYISENAKNLNCPVFIVNFKYLSTSINNNNAIGLIIYNLTKFDFEKFQQYLLKFNNNVITNITINIEPTKIDNTSIQTAFISINKDELKNQYELLSRQNNKINDSIEQITYKDFEINFFDNLKLIFQ